MFVGNLFGWYSVSTDALINNFATLLIICVMKNCFSLAEGK